MKNKLTAEVACANYAADHAAVKAWTAVMKANPCEQWESNRDKYGTGRKDSSECIALHWTSILQHSGGPDGYREVPMLDANAMCAGCRAMLAAFLARKVARARFGASKRAVLIVGKRAQPEVAQ
jgi:hypothetical protein